MILISCALIALGLANSYIGCKEYNPWDIIIGSILIFVGVVMAGAYFVR
jgi:hypothetical protein